MAKLVDGSASKSKDRVWFQATSLCYKEWKLCYKEWNVFVGILRK